MSGDHFFCYEYLQKRRLHNLTGQPFPVLCHPQCNVALSHVMVELLVLLVLYFRDIHNLTGQGFEQLYPTSELAVLLGAGPCILQEFDSRIINAKILAFFVQRSRRYPSTTSHEVSFT